ncbi:MAG: hypothetical protein HFH90_14995 [Lachnospiraceae bacterium]|nr:hypothetical protein [Lachnospiraceae bacterium]
MNRNRYPYSESSAEHRFAEFYNKVHSYVAEVINKKEKEDAINDLTDMVVKVTSEEEGRKRRLRSRVIVVIAFLVIVVGSASILEFIGPGAWLGYVVGALTMVCSILIDFFLNNSKMEYDRGENESICEGIINSVKRIVEVFRKRSNIHLIMLGGVAFFASGLLAEWSVLPHMAKFLEGGFIAVMDSDKDDSDGVGTENETDIYVAGQEQEISSHLKNMLTESDERLIEQLNRTEVTPEERNMELVLSATDYNTVFFQGEQLIVDYETQEEIDEKIFQWANEHVNYKRTNIFDKEEKDGGAPQAQKNQIARASAEEEGLCSFAQINERLDTREYINGEYPKRSLTQLVANDYHKLALLLVWNDGKKDTIFYYYGQCILNLFYCLEYEENTDKMIKQTLTSIAQKFRDMVYVWPEFEGKEIALKLEKAFRYAADQY